MIFNLGPISVIFGKSVALILARLATLELQIGAVMTTQAELVTQLQETAARVAKIGDETRALLARIVDLEAALANQTDLAPEVSAAMQALVAQVAVVDDLVKDPEMPPSVPDGS